MPFPPEHINLDPCPLHRVEHTMTELQLEAMDRAGEVVDPAALSTPPAATPAATGELNPIRLSAEAMNAATARGEQRWKGWDNSLTAPGMSLLYCVGRAVEEAVLTALAQPAPVAAPIDMVLYCPKCGKQHIDAPETREVYHGDSGPTEVADWMNPPHKSHLCHGCNHVWRPADVPTNGVEAVKTKGKNDSPVAAPAPAASEVHRAWALLKNQRADEAYAVLSVLVGWDHVNAVPFTSPSTPEPAAWCCEKGKAAGVPVCNECAEASAAYSSAMAPAPDDTPLETGEGDAL